MRSDEEVVSGGSGAEDGEGSASDVPSPGTPPPLPPKARKRTHKPPPTLDTSDEEEEPEEPAPSTSTGKKRKATAAEPKTDGAKGESSKKNAKRAKESSSIPAEKPDKPSKPARPTSLSIKNPLNEMMAKEMEFQKAMDIAVSILHPLKVDTKKLTMCPDMDTLECFSKGVQAWMNEHRLTVPLTYTTMKTFKSLVARFLISFVVKAADLSTGSWSPSGCYIWRHKSSEERGLHCFHGTTMIAKDHLVEMDLTSENAQKALKETPEKAKVMANRWGRQVVQIVNSDAACCFADVGCLGGNFSAKSCGLFYTEGAKALTAFKQIGAYQAASYPQMEDPYELMLIPVKCDCNWSTFTIQHGRQMCKVAPFAITGVSNIDRDQVEDPKVLASVENPAVLVFQCCNPVYKGSKAATATGNKNCDFKASAPDVLSALQLAKKIWASCVKDVPPPVKFPEFKWSTQYQVQNLVLPTGVEDDDPTPF
ncbi:DNA binding protein [Gould's wattled bat adenovirus 1]|nr:DNA binding protein [Mastadenovirus sp.]